jgi:hypothetical protein
VTIEGSERDTQQVSKLDMEMPSYEDGMLLFFTRKSNRANVDSVSRPTRMASLAGYIQGTFQVGTKRDGVIRDMDLAIYFGPTGKVRPTINPRAEWEHVHRAIEALNGNDRQLVVCVQDGIQRYGETLTVMGGAADRVHVQWRSENGTGPVHYLADPVLAGDYLTALIGAPVQRTVPKPLALTVAKQFCDGVSFSEEAIWVVSPLWRDQYTRP